MNVANILHLRTVEENIIPIVLEKLYTCYDLTCSRYEHLRTIEQLNIIKETKQHVCVQFQGIAYLLFFCMINDEKKHILISKKELKDVNEKNKLNEIKMYYMHIPYVNIKYYNGSILDGKVIKIDSKNDLSFIIHDLYFKDYSDIPIISKHDIIVNDFLFSLKKVRNILWTLAKFYTFNQLPDLLFSKLAQTNKKIIGLMFFGKFSCSYYVYTNEHEFSLLKNSKPLPKYKAYDNSLTEFYMQNTKTSDVYKLYDINDNTLYVGLAHIPDIYTSHFFRNKFSENEKVIKVKCFKCEKFNKWTPICDEFYDYDIINLEILK